jgi:hypothetical protein
MKKSEPLEYLMEKYKHIQDVLFEIYKDDSRAILDIVGDHNNIIMPL